ncbi:hypothetical protein DEU56DRAFT_978594 [Suillus clintonianus]|uniref:uncharacterized protein n=1 Tax=Suillus clintonianus TaxID=1904413 RepID=UPI001B884642|nr:uncharacterized protein DEU56DRAFT_978594 [Suillus clintonianus]KAG2146728.1 hypothetical protein DEU56DRAFT_978594 [Suillus clintonianus]
MRWLATVFTIQVLASLVEAAIMNITGTRGVQDNRYAKAHSLPESRSFDPRDGWEAVNISNLNYKYPASSHKDHSFHRALRRSSQSNTSASTGTSKYREKSAKTSNTTTTTGFLGTVVQSLASIFAGCIGKGVPQGVTITWYTGHDLENPSCWSNGGWAPTDKSFVGAVTLEGWATRPQCFKFIELCNGKSKCIFARIVDTCAGCAKGSRHVDLTRAAFTELANLDEGVLTVQMRQATDPDNWDNDLWGPQTTKS